MAYAQIKKSSIVTPMNNALSLFTTHVETVAELKELYRASEARAARMRLLSVIGRELALSDARTISECVLLCAHKIAHFLGYAHASVHYDAQENGLFIPFPSQPLDTPDEIRGDHLGTVVINTIKTLLDISDEEDRETVKMGLELMGMALYRISLDAKQVELLAKLQQREQSLEYLVGRLFSAQEDERRNLSHELHDGAAQTATALMRMLEGGTASSSEVLSQNDRLRCAQIARDLVKELRAIIGGLRPTLLDDLGFEAALRALSEGLEEAGYTVNLTINVVDFDWTLPVETALFRITQEAITNIRTHAGGPCRVDISLKTHLEHKADYKTLVLEVRDYGQGVTKKQHSAQRRNRGRHIGRDVMRERSSAIGGKFEWQALDNGVLLRVTLLSDRL